MRIAYKSCGGTQDEFEQLRQIHKAVMFNSIVETMGAWDDAFQLSRLERHWTQASETLKFILVDDKLAGTINFHEKDFNGASIPFVEQFYILPEWQGTGLGRQVLEHVTRDADEVRLSVLKNDTKANQFYINNGYVEYAQDDYQRFYSRTNPALETRPGF